MEHLNALEHRLFNEKQRLDAATGKREKEIRTVWVAQIEREIEKEKEFLRKRGIVAQDASADELPDMSDDELLAELFG